MRLCISALILLLGVSAGFTQFSIDWSRIAGGGGTSTGGVYSASGTIGQPDAGPTMSANNFSLVGGFWSLVSVVQTPGAPSLSLQRLGNAVRVYWPANASGFVLDQSLTVTGGWSQVSFPYATNGSEISITVSGPSGNKFYRLRKP